MDTSRDSRNVVNSGGTEYKSVSRKQVVRGVLTVTVKLEEGTSLWHARRTESLLSYVEDMTKCHHHNHNQKMMRSKIEKLKVPKMMIRKSPKIHQSQKSQSQQSPKSQIQSLMIPLSFTFSRWPSPTHPASNHPMGR